MAAMDVEERTQELGRELLAEADRYRPGAAERVQDWLLGLTASNERFRGRLLRYLDVLASADHDSSGSEAKRLAAEYFGDEFPELPRGLRWMLRLARDERVPARVMGESSRRAAELFARRFITPPGEGTITRTIRHLRDHGRYPSFDLLGEAVLSDREAEAYLARYLRLIGQLAEDPAAGEVTPGGVFALQVSLKLSSLTSHFSPVDPEGTIARVRPSLEAIVEAADRAGVGVTVDMEQFEYRDLTWELFTRTFARDERFGGWPGAGIVLQAYLREAAAHAGSYVDFAHERGVPFQVRLVKGAYWDYETIVAEAAGWTPPVFTRKAATDLAFEAVLARLVGAHPALRIAVPRRGGLTRASAKRSRRRSPRRAHGGANASRSARAMPGCLPPRPSRCAARPTRMRSLWATPSSRTPGASAAPSTLPPRAPRRGRLRPWPSARRSCVARPTCLRRAGTSSPRGSSTRAAATARVRGLRSRRPSTSCATTRRRPRHCSRTSVTASRLEASWR